MSSSVINSVKNLTFHNDHPLLLLIHNHSAHPSWLSPQELSQFPITLNYHTIYLNLTYLLKDLIKAHYQTNLTIAISSDETSRGIERSSH